MRTDHATLKWFFQLKTPKAVHKNADTLSIRTLQALLLGWWEGNGPLQNNDNGWCRLPDKLWQDQNEDLNLNDGQRPAWQEIARYFPDKYYGKAFGRYQNCGKAKVTIFLEELSVWCWLHVQKHCNVTDAKSRSCTSSWYVG